MKGVDEETMGFTVSPEELDKEVSTRARKLQELAIEAGLLAAPRPSPMSDEEMKNEVLTAMAFVTLGGFYRHWLQAVAGLTMTAVREGQRVPLAPMPTRMM